ncbi:hypothetical protein A3I18_00670 [Candidatus Campbellbacteria bacterium RIFCSPLOWO2_02_FULL_35_11]|uniref:Response regulatory domain-containing protein n=2 Tax=Candidatus Campbelliibacteriota TaxID=1752727 RepID=A0A1F5ENR1_9BACT|nr:MAG: hypothetical protein A3E89_01220 [Candidatus Campbellbacteria bacterium RIFCSPHIGHO2_12_FULL_35_10]OGD69896.1 MAG: hypothetical protein A3I18_00670 [Candidatus Campbellbacteria bacterium RIFCSPLOWO2_02_FULL_35_11]
MKKKVLIIEDDMLTVEAFLKRCESENFEIVRGRNGEEGLEIALREHPDLILLDIVMPVMDGETMLKKLRQDDWGKNAKVMILTNLDSSQKIMEAVNNNTFDYLIKSDWKIDDIVEKIKSKLEDK